MSEDTNRVLPACPTPEVHNSGEYVKVGLWGPFHEDLKKVDKEFQISINCLELTESVIIRVKSKTTHSLQNIMNLITEGFLENDSVEVDVIACIGRIKEPQ